MMLALARQLNNAQGAQIVSGGPMILSAESPDNNGGQLVSKSQLQVTVGDLLNGAEGTLAAHDALTINARGPSLVVLSRLGLISHLQSVIAPQ